MWFEYVHTKYPFFHIFMKLLDLQFYLRAKTKRHFFFTSMSSISSFFLRRMSRSSSLSSSERSSGTEIKKKNQIKQLWRTICRQPLRLRMGICASQQFCAQLFIQRSQGTPAADPMEDTRSSTVLREKQLELPLIRE